MRESFALAEPHVCYQWTATLGRKGLCDTLLTNVQCTSDPRMSTDHVWVFWSMPGKEGDTVTFYATVAPYTKGYLGEKSDIISKIEGDYKLDYIDRKSVV